MFHDHDHDLRCKVAASNFVVISPHGDSTISAYPGVSNSLSLPVFPGPPRTRFGLWCRTFRLRLTHVYLRLALYNCCSGFMVMLFIISRASQQMPTPRQTRLSARGRLLRSPVGRLVRHVRRKVVGSSRSIFNPLTEWLGHPIPRLSANTNSTSLKLVTHSMAH